MSSEVQINTPWIKLDAFMKFAGITATGVEAKEMIRSGVVFVNGQPCLMRGKKLFLGDTVTVNENTWEVAG